MLQLDLMGTVVGWLRDGWSQRSRVDQRRRRLRQLVVMVCAVTDAAGARHGDGGSLSAWLQELQAAAMRGQRLLGAAAAAAAAAGPGRRLVAFLRGAGADRLAEAVDDLERLAAPGGDLSTFLEAQRMCDAATTVVPAESRRRQREEEKRGSCCCATATETELVPVPGAKRKRAAGSLGTVSVEAAACPPGAASASLAPRALPEALPSLEGRSDGGARYLRNSTKMLNFIPKL
jgi:hypothetical protein